MSQTPIGTKIYRNDGTLFGSVERATEFSVWVNKDRYRILEGGEVRRFGGFHNGYVYYLEGSIGHTRNVEARARRQTITTIESITRRIRSDVATRTIAALQHRPGETTAEWTERAHKVEAAPNAAAEGAG